MKHIVLKAAAACTVVSMLFAGCGQKQEKLDRVTVCEVTHSIFYAPQYLAINLGFFEEEGIQIELSNGQGADKVMSAVLSDNIDIGFAGPEASVYVYNEGKEDYTQVFAQLTQRDGSFLVGRNPEPDFDWSNLKGKHILPGRRGGMPYMTLEYAMNKNGVEPHSQTNFDDSIQFAAMAGAFAGGTGDYVTIFEPTASMLEAEGKGYIVASVGEEAGEVPYTAYFAKKSFIEENPQLIQRFTNAVAKGQRWAASHSAEEIAEVIAPSFPDTQMELMVTVVQRYKDINAWSTMPQMNEKSFELLQEIMAQAGELDQKAPYDKIVNNDFAEMAA
ncbi:MAG: ABC transporter substrate-binding protein [Oscillospiraceae bacterium]|nr:ABC transporter substrate-binding protein [Oscillospiraceae bacterium]